MTLAEQTSPGSTCPNDRTLSGEGHMTDHLTDQMTDHQWPADVAERLREFLSEAFPGIHFQVVPLVAYNIATIDVAWTDGPCLHEVDLLALEFVLRIHLDAWGSDAHSRIDRVSNRRTMSPVVEGMLLEALAADMARDVRELDLDQVYLLPPILAASRYRPEKGTVSEFLDLLFESTSFNMVSPAEKPSTYPCTCALCA